VQPGDTDTASIHRLLQWVSARNWTTTHTNSGSQRYSKC